MSFKILAVDDSPSVCKLVQFTLETKGWQTKSAGNGRKALEIMASDRFDAIILDINMPEMNGLEFLQKVKSEDASKAIPVIMLTTEGQDEDRERAIALGAAAYVVKPFKPSQLLTVIEGILSDK